LGALTVTFPAKRSKVILSAQPSVRQLWMAVASRGIAHHFVWDAAQKKWFDDKGKGIEAESYLKQLLQDEVSLTVDF
jgi:frataxin-like iron-binding protein CyaY